MLNKELVKEKMKERGFIVYASIGNSKIQFVSEHMYNANYEENTPPRQRKPVINIFVDLEKDEFQCAYNISKSINSLNSPSCGSVLNDSHFDNIVSKFESEAKWMSRLTE
jgi:hypothetical protein